MKKAYIIPLVLLLLFVSVVPCFAYYVPEENPDPDYYFNHVGLWVLYPNYTILVNGTVTAWGEDISFYTSTTFTFKKGGFAPYTGTYYFYVNDTLVLTSDLETEQTLTVEYGDFIFVTLYQSNIYKFSNYSSNTVNLFWQTNGNRYIRIPPHRFMYFGYKNYISPVKISLPAKKLYNGVFYDTSTQLNYTSGDVVVADPQMEGQPFINFYRDLSHSFDWLPELVSTYYIPLMIFGAIFSILIFIFVVVFMIKRFTGGNT